jgi:putative ABC transport system permease protein
MNEGERMLSNYLKIALRNLIRHKAFSLINIFGLAVGMACTILILLWVQDELSFDRFHKNADRIYLVLRGDANGLTAVTSKLLGSALQEELPEVQRTTCMMPVPEAITCVIQHGNNAFEEKITLADSGFFNVFSFPVKEGNPATALADPYSVVITEENAKKYFGNEDALGKSLVVSLLGQQLSMKVSAVLNNIPDNSHIQCKVIFPITFLQTLGIPEYGWQNQSYNTYILLTAASGHTLDITELSSKIKACELRHDSNQPKSLLYSLLPLTKVHLYSSNLKVFIPTGDIKYVQIFLAVAGIILLIAAFNYVNLSTALSLKRTGEVGIRKTVGASRGNLLMQFFGESFLLILLALGVALLLANLFLPEFNVLSGKRLVIRYGDPSFIGIIVLVALFTGVVSGVYPALFLSSFTPVQILKGKIKMNLSSIFVREGLVVFQFALSIIIIICTVVVFDQLSFMKKSNLGFDKENILCIRLTSATGRRYDVLRNELQKNPDILGVARSEPLSGGPLSSTLGVSWPGKLQNLESHFWIFHSDFNLASVYKFEMKQGRFYSEQFPSDSTGAYVVNEAAVKLMNFKSPIGEEIQVWGRKGKIIGVIKNFHFASFHSVIEPLIVRIPDKNDAGGRYPNISILFKPGMLEEIVAYVEKVWHEQMQDIPLNYYFFDDSLNAQYGSEQRMGSIFRYFAFLSIALAYLGLFGLASLSAQRRTKEIGVRKVLGASIWNVSFTLSKEFLKWVIVSNVIAWPVAYYVMHQWLQNFAYRVNLTIWVFLFAGVIALIGALLTVSWHAIRVATANPVDALRYE